MLLLAPEFLTPARTKSNGRKRHLTAPWSGSQRAALQNFYFFFFFKLFLLQWLVITNISHRVFSRRKLGASNPFFAPQILPLTPLIFWVFFHYQNILTNSVHLWGINYSMSIGWTLVGNFLYSKHFKILMYCLNHQFAHPLTLVILRLDSSLICVGGFCHLVYESSLQVANLFL